MNREEFVDENRDDWWLVDRQPDAEITTLRDQLGEALGFSSEPDWYTKPERLERLWQVVEQNPDLASKLDQAQDRDARKVWIESATEVIEAATATAQAGPAQTASAQSAPASNAPTSASSTAPAQTAEPEAPKRPGLFNKKADESDAPTDPPSSQNEAATEQASPANKSPFAKKSVAAEEESVESVDVTELKESVSDLLADDSIPLNANDVDKLAARPNFDAEFAQATAAIQAEMDAADDDDDWDLDGEDFEDEGEEELERAES